MIVPRPLWGLAMTLTLLVFSSGCSVLNNLDQLLTLNEYSKEKDEQKKIVDKTDAQYDALAAAINSGEIKKYTNEASIREAFGEPISIKALDHQEQWLYRHAIPLKAKDKVYLYFDGQGKLLKYEQEQIQW